jgi:hypothetical protein
MSYQNVSEIRYEIDIAGGIYIAEVKSSDGASAVLKIVKGQ